MPSPVAALNLTKRNWSLTGASGSPQDGPRLPEPRVTRLPRNLRLIAREGEREKELARWRRTRRPARNDGMESMGGMDGMVLPELWYTWMVWMVCLVWMVHIRWTDDEFYFWRSRVDNPNDEPKVCYFGRFWGIFSSDELRPISDGSPNSPERDVGVGPDAPQA